MSMEEKGFFDGVMEDITSTVGTIAAIEASRDENGKIDVAKATGISMGLGLTSDHDIATMGAMLGAEDAFNDDADSSEDDLFDDFSTPIAPNPQYTTSNFHAERAMTEAEYKDKKASILAEKRLIIGTAIVGLALFTFLFLYLMCKYINSEGIFLSLLILVDALLYYAIFRTNQARYRELGALDNKYRQSKQKEKEKEKTAEQTRNELKNCAGTQDIPTIVSVISRKMKHFFDTADKESGITEPTFSPDIVFGLLNGLLYLSIKDCNLIAVEKAWLYDSAVSQMGTYSLDCNGNMLFLDGQTILDKILQNLVHEALTATVVAAAKFDSPDNIMDFTNPICALMILLGERFERDFGYKGFETSAIRIILDMTKKAIRRVIDERLLDSDEPSDTQSDPIKDSTETEATNETAEINMNSIMGKVNDLVSDKSFLSKKLTGHEFEITCDACGEKVNVVITEQLIGTCPLCGHENELNFYIK